ncbi:hypothetical protein PPERSA_04601 [Pseudocohnilembus persalinus]|uniref:Tetratricopeptide repeat protein n=1 Tax=Pseudocohnilembus persalinus TaxID=266149 RepID=A0A0V0QNG8_PSEPJ|nr:hypothetical protein PPERSA_04601 [Pseudocohnilembus persalinus]|eukprot:KRX03806.1 hypothetical protein PPERSA_04601 [Pseudocohnilembus persalinus]
MDNQQQIQVQPLLYKNNNSINSLPNQKTPNQGDYNENFQTQKRQSQNSDSQNQDSQTKNVQNNNNNNKNRFVSGNQFQSQKANQQQKQQQQRYEQKQKISARNSQSSQNTDNNNNNQNNNNDKNNDKNNSQNNNSQVYLNQDFKKIQYDFLESETENQEEEKMLQELKQLMKEIQIEFKLGLAREGLQKAIEIIYRAEKELNSVHYQEIFEDLIKQLNYSSIDVLNYGFLDHALIVLNQCDQLIENNPMDHIELKVLTLNHLGCIYRRGNSFEQAFSCLNNAQQLVYQNQLKEYAGLTYLNLSALFSQVGNHNSALDNAQKAKTLQLQEFEEYLKNQSEQEKLEYNFDKNNKNPAQNYLQNQDYLNKATTLIICHHNIASELEYFQQLDEALQNYEESCKLAQSHLGYIHPITQTFRQEYQDFQIRYAQKKISDQNKRQ